jgi:hypothetical protein
MKTANKLVVATALTAISGLANAAIVEYTIFGGNWDSISQWTGSADGTPSTFVYDNGEVPGCEGFPPGFNCWGNPFGTGTAPGPMNGTYGGSLLVDSATNAVVGGTLEVTGAIADAVVVGTTWWVRQYNNLTIDFATGVATTTSNQCYATGAAPIGCFAVINPNSHTGIFAPLTGIASQNPAGTGGIPYLGSTFATFDATSGVLQLFRNGRNPAAPNGTDVLNRFTLQIVPVPAAVWLFGSALGLLGVARRKLVA